MIGAKELHPAVVASYYGSFHANYFEPEFRRLNAETLVPGNKPREMEWEYPTRAILAAQWNDTCEQGLETAKVLYSLNPTLHYYLGQSVLELTSINASEVATVRKGGKLPPFKFSIDIGVIDKETLPEYGFRKTPARLLPADVDPKNTFLDYQVSLPVVAGARIDISSDGKVDVNEPLRERADFVAYSGRVSLEHDPVLYDRIRQTKIGNLALGNGRSFGIIYEILKTVGGSQQEAFQELFISGEVSPYQPLDNLELLAN